MCVMFQESCVLISIGCALKSINLDSSISIRYVNTKHQITDTQTKGSFTKEKERCFLHYPVTNTFAQRSDVQSVQAPLPGTIARSKEQPLGQK